MRPAGTTAVVTGSFPAVAIAVAIVSGAAGMVGVYLDTAWHRTVGRDSFFILPHVFIYCGGLGVLGAALTSVARATPGRAEDFGGPGLPPPRPPPPPRLARPPPRGFLVTAPAPRGGVRAPALVSAVPRRHMAHGRHAAGDRVRPLHADPDPGPPRRRPLARVLGRRTPAGPQPARRRVAVGRGGGRVHRRLRDDGVRVDGLGRRAAVGNRARARGAPPRPRDRRAGRVGGMGPPRGLSGRGLSQRRRRHVRQPVASPRRRDRRHRAGPGRSRGDLSAPALWPADARGRAQARSVLGVPVPGGDLLERGACRGMALRA